jgi:hypothetical protein
MSIELDHVFVCSSPGAPEAEELIRIGFREGAPNRQAGQGTANRRFAFVNAMIELLWVCDEQEAQSEITRRTLLWDRWIARNGQACPFGICLRPAASVGVGAPFSALDYRPAYLPDPLALQIAEAGLEEPMWVYLSFMSRDKRKQHFAEHPNGAREITGLTLTTVEPLASSAAHCVVLSGILTARIGSETLLEIEFDHGKRSATFDLRPKLPILIRL